jgi:hypothetical protein
VEGESEMAYFFDKRYGGCICNLGTESGAFTGVHSDRCEEMRAWFREMGMLCVELTEELEDMTHPCPTAATRDLLFRAATAIKASSLK